MTEDVVSTTGDALVTDAPSTRADAGARWRPIETAPRDGRKIDLLYPYPRGRTIDCYWDVVVQAWLWRSPKWRNGVVLPEVEWPYNSYPNTEPTHWMSPPEPPCVEVEGKTTEAGSSGDAP